MRKASWSLFTYPVMDIKAAEALLNRRALEGWTLDRVWLGTFARFVPAGVPEVWCVDWSRRGYSEQPDYLALCADAGWTLVQKVGAFNLYKAPPGTPPIQTDGEEETRRFRRERTLPETPRQVRSFRGFQNHVRNLRPGRRRRPTDEARPVAGGCPAEGGSWTARGGRRAAASDS